MRSKRAIYNIITNLLLQGAMILYGFVVPKVIIDAFGSDINGLVTSITQFLGYITFLESGFGPVVRATLYDVIAKKDDRVIKGVLKTTEKFFRRIALIFIVYIFVLCLVFPLIVREKFDTIFTVSLVVIIGISTFAEYFFGMTYRLFLQAKQKMYVVSLIQTISYVLSIAAVVILALIGQDIIVIKLVSGLLFMLRPILQNLYVKKKYHIYLNDVQDSCPIKQKWDGLAQHIAAVIRDNTDVTVLTVFTTLAEVSVYSVYYLVVFGIRRILLAFSNSFDASFGDMIAKKEDENLRKKFSAYELLYMLIITAVFVCAFLLITPFVSVYTKGVTDADYIRPVFGYLLVLSGYIFAIIIPYSSLTLAAGHFRETKKGAWVEAGVNIVLSVVLVANYGLIGVAIGTAVAMFIRMIEFIYHTNRYVLKRKAWFSVKKILISVVTLILLIIVLYYSLDLKSSDYIGWLFDAFVVFTIAMTISALFYVVLCKKEACILLFQIKKSLSHICNKDKRRIK